MFVIWFILPLLERKSDANGQIILFKSRRAYIYTVYEILCFSI